MRAVHVLSIVSSVILAAALGSAVGVHEARSQQEEERFKNLKVFPKDISSRELRATMSQFTRALGVRCSFCHVSRPGQPMSPDDWASDDKPVKLEARKMMEMTRDLNDKYLAQLDRKDDPNPIQIGCFTCHHGAPEPRMLQDVLKLAYADGGLDSTRARYQRLRDRYYGRAVFDFGDVPLADVANSLADSGHVADAASLFALNAQMNPSSPFAQRQSGVGAMLLAFSEQGGDSGVAVYQRVKPQLGQPRETEQILGGIGHRLMVSGKSASAIAALKLNADEHPTSGDAFDDLGEAYLSRGDKKLAIESYLKAVALDSTNTNAVKQLEQLKVSKGKIAKAREHR